MTKLITPAKILIVDDEPGLREILNINLSNQGYEVTVAANGNAAVQVLSESFFDLVITDLVMMGGDGYAVMEYIDSQRLDTLVIVITGFGSMDSAVEALRRGAADYIQKPFKLALLNMAVTRALEQQSLSRELDYRVEQLGVLAEMTQTINANLDIEQVYKTLAREAGRVIDLDRMTLSLLIPGGRQLRQKTLVSSNVSAEDESILSSTQNSGEWQVIEEQQPFLSLNVTQDDRIASWQEPPPAGTRSLVIAPLTVKEKPIGTLSFGHSRPDAFSQNDIAIIEQIAGQLATAIENARLLHQTQEQLKTLQRTQVELVRSARLTAVGELARGLAHELNNPLAIILGIIQFLQTQSDLPVKLAADLDKISSSALRMADLVRNFSEFARPASDEPRILNVNVVAKQALTLMHSRFSKNDIKVETAFTSPPPLISGYSHQIEQMLINLLLNADEAIAQKKAPPEGHKISIKTSISSDKTGEDWVHIDIHDTGNGIAPADLTRIFDPGYTTKVENGKIRALGMGLYVSYGLVKTYDGAIDVESQLGQGSCFTIRLPVKIRGQHGTVGK